MRSWGPRRGHDGEQVLGAGHGVGQYTIVATLWTRSFAGGAQGRADGDGQIRCELVTRSGGSGKRLVRLVASFREAGRLVDVVRLVESSAEEQWAASMLEARIRKAGAARESLAQAAPSAP